MRTLAANPLQALENLKPSLAPGGRVLVRDYARGDLAQSRLSEPGRVQRLADDFYVRWDGTRAFYFTQVGDLRAACACRHRQAATLQVAGIWETP